MDGFDGVFDLDVAGFLLGADFGLLLGCLMLAGRGGTAGFCLSGGVGSGADGWGWGEGTGATAVLATIGLTGDGVFGFGAVVVVAVLTDFTGERDGDGEDFGAVFNDSGFGGIFGFSADAGGVFGAGGDGGAATGSAATGSLVFRGGNFLSAGADGLEFKFLGFGGTTGLVGERLAGTVLGLVAPLAGAAGALAGAAAALTGDGDFPGVAFFSFFLPSDFVSLSDLS